VSCSDHFPSPRIAGSPAGIFLSLPGWRCPNENVRKVILPCPLHPLCPRHPPNHTQTHTRTQRPHTQTEPKTAPITFAQRKSWLEAIKAGVFEPAVDSPIIEPSQPTCRSQLGCSIVRLHRNHSVGAAPGRLQEVNGLNRSNSRRNQRIRLCRIGLIRR
jgi:hypothetical protein